MSAKSGVLAVFDIDGTLCDTQGSDGFCFGRAVESVMGRPFAAQDWTTFEEPTGGAILRDLLADDPDAVGKEIAIKTEFLRLLEEQRRLCPSEFMPIPGASAFIDRLRCGAICEVAIATGCFDISASFKLRCCGLDLTGFPHATSSDTPRRQDIIRLAASRAGFALSSIVHFGDGPWDVKATRAVGVPMIGLGRGYTKLHSLGVENVFRDYTDADSIISVLDTFRAPRFVAHPLSVSVPRKRTGTEGCGSSEVLG